MKATFKSAWGYQGDNMNLPVADVDTAAPFYTRVMGFREESRADKPHKTVILERDGIKIGLVENGGDPTQDGCAFRVDSVEAARNEFKQNGLDKEISDFSTEEHDGETFKVFYMVAPDGLCYWFGEKSS
jgi:catechol 2,3-dioxygenase-like lactoylglutathione lyase family enzyme